jgi:primosomal protein N'
MRDRNFDKLEEACRRIRKVIDNIVERERLELIVRGPVPAVITRIQRFHRMQIIIQAPQAEIIRQLFACLRTTEPVRPAVMTAIDIDPVNLL